MRSVPRGMLLGELLKLHLLDETVQSLARFCRFVAIRPIPGGQDRSFSVLRNEHQVRRRVKREVAYDDQSSLDFERTRPDESAGERERKPNIRSVCHGMAAMYDRRESPCVLAPAVPGDCG